MPLSDAAIRNAKPAVKPYTLSDSGALFLYVMPNGSKLWRYRFRWFDRQQTYSIGAYPAVGLAAARQCRDQAKKVLATGQHPTRQQKLEQLARRTANANSFEAISRDYMQSQTKVWDARYAQRVRRFMEVDVFPKIGQLPIANISAPEILAILRDVEKRGSLTVAEKLRIWIGGVFRYAVATGLTNQDPTYTLRHALHPSPPVHAAALDKRRIPSLVEALNAFEQAEPQLALGLKLLLLTFVRGSELREARWSELDLQNAEWRIPAARMKSRQEHIVLLSPQAVVLFGRLQRLSGESLLLFPSPSSIATPISAPMWSKALARIGFATEIRPHGFRSTASTLLNELGYEPDWIERQLAHMPRNRTRASYNHAQYLPERRRMMNEWANYIDERCHESGSVGLV